VNLLRRCRLAKFTGKKAAPTVRKARRTWLEIESLERRDTPSTITYQGGAVLNHVEVQALYLGSDWVNNPTLLNQVFQFNGFLNTTVNSSYMDMLTNADYGVGRGTTGPAVLDPISINKNQFLTDAQIQADIKSQINVSGGLQMPINNNTGVADPNRLYVVFVEPGVAVQMGDGENSLNNFSGYHSAFGYNYPVNANGLQYIGTADAHYAVITYAGSNTPLGTNATISFLDTFDSMTNVTSHELAEAVTDPNIGYKTDGWIGNPSNGETEVGDLANQSTVYLNGYAVQRIADQNGQPMTPQGATSQTPMDFVLRGDGTFWVRNEDLTSVGRAQEFVDIIGVGVGAGANGGFTLEATGVASISDQGIDNFGQAMVDVVFDNGTAAEYHAGSGTQWVDLPVPGTVQQAKAGQGVSYVLTTSGSLYEYTDFNPGTGTGNTLSAALDNNVQSIDAGTDAHGANMVAYVRTDWYSRTIRYKDRPITTWYTRPDAYERSDSFSGSTAPLVLIGTYVQTVSAGQQGNIAYVTTTGAAYWYDALTGSNTYIASGVKAITAGTIPGGYLLLDMLFANGNLSQSEEGGWWTSVAKNVTSIGKAHDGVLDVVFSGGNAYSYSYFSEGLSFLTNDVETAA